MSEYNGNKREFKFRICHDPHSEHRSIIYKSDNFMIDLEGYVVEDYGRYGDKPCSCLERVFDAEVTIQQWTGLVDKNGKDIYEGDIISYMYDEKIYEVRWSEAYSGLQFNLHRVDNGEINDYYYGGIPMLEYLEVIGNTFLGYNNETRSKSENNE